MAFESQSMGEGEKRARVWRCWRVFRRWAGRCVLGILTGCRSPAQPYTAQPGAIVPPRAAVVVRQVMEDSALELANRPLATSWECLTETTDHLFAWFEGGVTKRVIMPLWGEPLPLPDHTETLDTAELDRELERLTGRSLQPANMNLYVEGHETLRVLQELIAQATSQIDIIMFNWEGDALGEALAAQLAQRAGPELRVRILVDGGGNLIFGEPEDASAATVNRALATLARHPHIEIVRIRNPFARFDHRKLVLIDGRLVWSGGRNFSGASFFEYHDVSFVVDGPLALQLQERFDHDWRTQTGGTPFLLRACAVAPPSIPSSTSSPRITDHQTQPTNALARVLHSEPGRRQIAQALYQAVDSARHHIYVENVYFSDSRLLYKLAQARRRGVDVRVVLSVHTTTDMHNRANRVLANRLLRAGVRVYLYPGMTHVKAVSVDGVWAYLGTGNFDPLSLRHNNEIGLAIHASPVIRELEECLFQRDFRPQWELTQPLPVSIKDHLAELLASMYM